MVYLVKDWVKKVFSGLHRIPSDLRNEFILTNSKSNLDKEIAVSILLFFHYILTVSITDFLINIQSVEVKSNICTNFFYLVSLTPLISVFLISVTAKKISEIKNRDNHLYIYADRLNTIILLFGTTTTAILIKSTSIYELSFIIVALVINHPPKFYIPIYIFNFLYITIGFLHYTNKWEASDLIAGASLLTITILGFIASRLRLTDKISSFLTRKKIEEQNIILNNQNTKLKEMTRIDGLTKVKNRRAFDEAIDLEWRRALRGKGRIGVLMIDVDMFKKYNDKYGHQKGDDCLKIVAKTLKENIKRASDMVARYGGEEFSVILINIDHLELLEFAESLREKIENLRIEHKGSESGFVTISVGGASFVPKQGMSVEKLIELADTSLYDAKKLGRNRVVINNDYE